MVSQSAFPPRYFWRRVGATLIDMLLATIVSLLILLPFLGNTDHVRLDESGFYRKFCVNVTSIPPEAFAVIAPEQPAAAVACKTSVFGINNGMTMQLIYGVSRSGSMTFQRNANFAIDAAGKPVTPLTPQSLLMAALLIGVGGFLLRRRGQSPGKRLLGLRVIAAETHPFRREALKYLLLILNGMVLLVTWALGPTLLPRMAALSGATIGIGAVLFALACAAYYLLPLLRWRGAMPWDRMVGSFVTLSSTVQSSTVQSSAASSSADPEI